MDSDEYNDDGQCTIEPIRSDQPAGSFADHKETKETKKTDQQSGDAGGQLSGRPANGPAVAVIGSVADTDHHSSPDDSNQNAPQYAGSEAGTSDRLNASGQLDAADRLNTPGAVPERMSPVDRPASQVIEDDDSTASSSHPPVAALFKPNYVIAVLPSELEVDEYSVYYSIKAINIGRTSDSKGDLRAGRKEAPEEMIVKREFDDFLYLNHVLVNSGSNRLFGFLLGSATE